LRAEDRDWAEPHWRDHVPRGMLESRDPEELSERRAAPQDRVATAIRCNLREVRVDGR
jgi:hypothetical protein